MIGYYIELTLRQTSEIPLHFLWSKIYLQVHLALVEKKNEQGRSAIGSSFPGFHTGEENGDSELGNKLRLLSSNINSLEELQLPKWFIRFSDYVQLTDIRSIPKEVEGFAYFKRIQPKRNNERLARRYAKRIKVSMEEAREHFSGRKSVCSNVPFINIKSLSSARNYRLAIDRVNADSPIFENGFSTYGLSSKSTVPLF